MADWTGQHGRATPDTVGADPVDGLIAETRAFVEARPAPDLEAAVMLAIGQTGQRPEGRWRRVMGSLWTPREVSFRVRPAYGMLAAAAVFALAVLAPAGFRTSGDGATPPPPPAQETLLVQFRLEARDVSDVRLAGSFTDWQPRYELHQTAPGLWPPPGVGRPDGAGERGPGTVGPPAGVPAPGKPPQAGRPGGPPVTPGPPITPPGAGRGGGPDTP